MAFNYSIVRAGYRKLRGGCTDEMGSSTYEHHTNEYKRIPLGRYTDPGAGNIKEIEGANGRGEEPDNSTAIGMHGMNNVPPPPMGVKSDVSLSAKHHRESITFNTAHAREHEKEAVKHKKALVSLNRKRK